MGAFTSIAPSVGIFDREPNRAILSDGRIYHPFTHAFASRASHQQQQPQWGSKPREETTMETKAGKGRVRHITAIAAGVLVVTTALIGAAARGKGTAPGTAIPSTGSAPTQFSAPGGGPVTFTGTLDRTAVRKGSDGRVRLELVIAAQPQPGEHAQRVPTDLMVILDRSGSMAGEKLEQARAAVRALIAQLGPEDRFGFVTYSNDARLEIPLTAAGDRERGLWLSVL